MKTDKKNNMTSHLKTACLLVLLALSVALFSAPSARAQLDPSAATQRQPPTPAVQIAMIFSRLSGEAPDFEDWVKGTREYTAASDFDKSVIIERRTPELRQQYGLISFEDPVIIEQVVTLSRYSVSKRGFFIENFTDDTFYSYKFLDRNYALIPTGIMDHQWVPVPEDEDGKRIEGIVAPRGNQVLMQMHVTPKTADGKAPLVIDGEEFWLLAGDIKKIALFSLTRGSLLWESGIVERREKAQQELLDLYK